eukprot:CCRYP_010665-RA/>CCRYP_010665-RA protein AED:0.25 eAED:0.45 QI:0/-1/0/1/-1/0/1/0/217
MICSIGTNWSGNFHPSQTVATIWTLPSPGPNHSVYPLQKSTKSVSLLTPSLRTPKGATQQPYLWQHPTHTPPLLHTAGNPKNTRAFHQRLTDRGYPSTTITPLFRKATHNALQYMACSPDDHATRQCKLKEKTANTVFLHLQYHPQGPPARDLQHLWQQTVAAPPGEVPLPDTKNIDGAHVPIHSLTIAYSHPPNLRNQLSIRTIKNRGRADSSYIA